MTPQAAPLTRQVVTHIVIIVSPRNVWFKSCIGVIGGVRSSGHASGGGGSCCGLLWGSSGDSNTSYCCGSSVFVVSGLANGYHSIF